MEKVFLSWDKVYVDSIYLGQKISNLSINFKGIIAISRGGLFPALILSQYLSIGLVDTYCLSSYSGESTTSGDLQSLKLPNPDCIVEDGKNWLVVDDLVDTGKTFEYVKELYSKAEFCVLYSKPMGQKMVNTFVSPFSQDTWIVFPWE